MTALIDTGTPSATQHLKPATLNTVEKLLLWALLLFHRLNSGKDLLFIGDTSAVKQISYNNFLGQDKHLYLGFTVFIPVDRDYLVKELKPWEYAIELNDAVAAPEYNS
jgi:hypothetical protein